MSDQKKSENVVLEISKDDILQQLAEVLGFEVEDLKLGAELGKDLECTGDDFYWIVYAFCNYATKDGLEIPLCNDDINQETKISDLIEIVQQAFKNAKEPQSDDGVDDVGDNFVRSYI